MFILLINELDYDWINLKDKWALEPRKLHVLLVYAVRVFKFKYELNVWNKSWAECLECDTVVWDENIGAIEDWKIAARED